MCLTPCQFCCSACILFLEKEGGGRGRGRTFSFSEMILTVRQSHSLSAVFGVTKLFIKRTPTLRRDVLTPPSWLRTDYLFFTCKFAYHLAGYTMQHYLDHSKVKVKVKFTLEHATKARRGNRGIALFLLLLLLLLLLLKSLSAYAPDAPHP